jgi:hypothetical protein
MYFILPLTFSIVYICASHLRAGFVSAFCLVHRLNFTCSHLLAPSSHGFPSVFDNSKLALFIKFCITMILSEPLALWIFILVYASSLLEGLFVPDILCFRDFK